MQKPRKPATEATVRWPSLSWGCFVPISYQFLAIAPEAPHLVPGVGVPRTVAGSTPRRADTTFTPRAFRVCTHSETPHEHEEPKRLAGELGSWRPVRKVLGRAELSVQVTGMVRTLEAVSAYDLMVSHRQLDLDPLPTGGFAAEETIAALSGSEAAPDTT